jgi:hypothetical protein
MSKTVILQNTNMMSRMVAYEARVRGKEVFYKDADGNIIPFDEACEIYKK